MLFCGGSGYKLNFTVYCYTHNQNLTLTHNTHHLSFYKNPYYAMLLTASLRTFIVSLFHMIEKSRINYINLNDKCGHHLMKP